MITIAIITIISFTTGLSTITLSVTILISISIVSCYHYTIIIVIGSAEAYSRNKCILCNFSGCGLRGTNHTFEVFRGPKILRTSLIAFFHVRGYAITSAYMPKP